MDSVTTMGEQKNGSVLVPTNQSITPIGQVERIEGERVKDIELSPDGQTLAVVAQTRLILYSAQGKRITYLPIHAGSLGLAWTPDSETLFVSGGNGQVYHVGKASHHAWHILTSFLVAKLVEKQPGEPPPAGEAPNVEWRPDATIGHHLKPVPKPSRFVGNPDVTGLAVSPDGSRLYIALSKRNAITVVDIASETIIATVPVGVAPFRIVVSSDGRTVLVANRGGRHAKKGELSAISGGTAVRIDRTTDAALRGSISFIDTKTFARRELEAGRQPAGLCLTHDGKTLYVANSDEDTVSAIDVVERRVRRTVSLEPALDTGFGQMPNDLVISSDQKLLYVTCGGANAVAVLTLPDLAVKGYFSTGWFPLALTERGGRLFVGSSKGIGARLKGGKGYHSAGTISTVQFIAQSDRLDLPALTRQVASNNHWATPELAPRPDRKPVPIPERVGEPSLFHHVVYIIKENHSYDLDMGDVGEGNSDQSLCLFGEEITPNEHALARDFVLLDNTYASGTNSADGHQWTDSAIANAYVEQNYESYARSYPFNGTDPLAYSPAGFIWTSAMRAGKSVRVYGEFVDRPRTYDPTAPKRRLIWSDFWEDYKSGAHKYVIKAETDNVSLRRCLNPNYIGFPLTVSDQWRADQYLAELKKFEAEEIAAGLVHPALAGQPHRRDDPGDADARFLRGRQ